MEDKKTLLIVEDDKYIINFISMTLKKEEYAFFNWRADLLYAVFVLK